jgi:hypothetical protein
MMPNTGLWMTETVTIPPAELHSPSTAASMHPYRKGGE